MLTVIVFVFLLTELPQGLLTLAAGVYPQLTVLAGLLTSVFDLLSLTNSAVNFVLCALMSHVFRRLAIFKNSSQKYVKGIFENFLYLLLLLAFN